MQTRAGGPRDPRRAATVIEALGLDVPSAVVRVVGTNGKGTVSAMLAAGLSAAGHVTGRFLSPHVESFTERVAVDGAPVTREEVVSFVARARESLAPGGALHDLPVNRRPAFFEWTLALALERFAAASVDVAVLEAGVGGTADATSAAVADNVRLVVITNVDLDHTETLGRTVAAIAAEKAGAITRGVPVVTGATGEALEVVRAAAHAASAPLHVDTPHDPLFAAAPAATYPGRWSPTREANARLAAAGLRLLGVGEAAVVAGVSAPPLPGRGELFTVAGRSVLLDGAHDPAAAARLVEPLRPGYVLLFGSLARKQGLATFAVLAAHATEVVLTEAQQGEGIIEFTTGPHWREPEPAAALERALALTPPGGLVLVAGSLYLAGRLRPLLHSRTA